MLFRSMKISKNQLRNVVRKMLNEQTAGANIDPLDMLSDAQSKIYTVVGEGMLDDATHDRLESVLKELDDIINTMTSY